MAKAKIDGVEYDVRVTRDLTDNWAVEIAPIPAVPRKWEVYKPVPPRILVKVHADTREAAAKAVLEQLKASKKIDDFTA
jgi:hypothetical protein